jgi:hypothetical protein
MLDGAIVIPIQTLVWNVLFEVAALLWLVNRALLSVGYFIMALTGWITQNAFAPLLTVISDQTGVLVGPIFVLALTILGLTYILAVFGNFEVVNLRAATLWLLFAGFLFTFGPSAYTGMENLRRLMGGGFYEAGVTALNDASSASGLSVIGATPGDTIPAPTDQFGQFLPGVPGAAAVDGLDVALAYVAADGYDALAAAGSSHPIARLPYQMVALNQGGFFDPATGPTMFGSMSDQDRQASIGQGIQGVWRLFTLLFIVIFGIIEQLVNFLMACAFAVAFFSMFIAVLFAFFRRTEPIAWGALNLIIELFIQSLINSLLMSLILGFVMIGANTNNAILLLGTSIVGLYLSWNLLQGCIKGLMNSTERLYKSFSAATGGNFATLGETNQAAVSAALSAATGASVLAGGGSFLQAAGATFGDQRTAQAMNYAARMLGGEDTLLGSAAQALGEGASARSLGGPLGGYLLGKQTQQRRNDQQARTQRQSYVGDLDEKQDAALLTYRTTGYAEELDTAFSSQDVPRVQALEDQFDEDDFATTVQAVRRVRNDNPQLSPQSPIFQEKVRNELPAPLREMEPPALQAFAELFGGVADTSAYQSALAQFTPQPNYTVGEADRARDAAVAGKLPLEEAFSPDDAHRVAQLMDAYDDDDFALLVDAVRATRQAQPDAQPGSLSVLQATRQNLPPHLQNVPSRDLAAFSKAFGASANRPAIPDEPAKPYVGAADQARDGVVELFQDGAEDRDILQQAFLPREAQDVATLAREYGQDDFAAVVGAVRQARTADPELEAGSPSAVRATRKLLPPRLKPMPSRDLTAFSRAFGVSPDVPALRNDEDPERLRRPTRAPALPPLPTVDHSATQPLELPNGEPALPASATDLYQQPAIPPTFATPVEHALGLDQPAIPTPLVGLRRMKPAQRQGLEQGGIDNMEKLADATLPQIMQAAQVTELRADEWRTSARTVVRAQAARTRQQVEQLETVPPLPQPTVEQQPLPVVNSTPLAPMPGLGQGRLQRLATQGITTAEQFVAADRGQIAQNLRVSVGQVQTWQQTAQSSLIAPALVATTPAANANPPDSTLPIVPTPTVNPVPTAPASMNPTPARTVLPIPTATPVPPAPRPAVPTPTVNPTPVPPAPVNYTPAVPVLTNPTPPRPVAATPTANPTPVPPAPANYTPAAPVSTNPTPPRPAAPTSVNPTFVPPVPTTYAPADPGAIKPTAAPSSVAPTSTTNPSPVSAVPAAYVLVDPGATKPIAPSRPPTSKPPAARTDDLPEPPDWPPSLPPDGPIWEEE